MGDEKDKKARFKRAFFFELYFGFIHRQGTLGMKPIIFFCIASMASSAIAADTYTPAVLEKLLQQDAAKPGYDQYAQGFMQYDNSLHHDDHCFSVAGGSVTLYLVVAQDGSVSAVTAADDAKSQCFKQPYTGMHFKVPPFSPFVLKMQF